MEFMDPADVVNDDTLMEYARQRLGCPAFPKDTIVFRKTARDFHRCNPHVDYRSLVRVVDWCKATNRRPFTLAALFRFCQDAYRAGILIGVETHAERSLMSEVYAALKVEKDPEWRRQIISSSGSAQRELLATWKRQRSA